MQLQDKFNKLNFKVVIMSGIILYQSKYGATKRYAMWLSEETGFDCKETKKAKIEDIKKYDTIILGGGIYASGVAGLSFLKKNISALSGKKIVVFCVGASPYDENAFKQIVAFNMKNALDKVPCFYCRGAWDMKKMTAVDRNLCKMLRKVVAKKNPDDYEIWEKALMAAGDESCNWTDKSYIKPILEAVR